MNGDFSELVGNDKEGLLLTSRDVDQALSASLKDVTVGIQHPTKLPNVTSQPSREEARVS